MNHAYATGCVIRWRWNAHLICCIIHMCDVTRILIRVRVTAHSYVWCYTNSHSCACHRSFICVIWIMYTAEIVSYALQKSPAKEPIFWGAECVLNMLRHLCVWYHGVATISRLLEIIGLFCKRALQKSLYSEAQNVRWICCVNYVCDIMWWLWLVGSLKL